MEILSSNNVKVKTWQKYHIKKHRDKDNKFLIEGEHLIQEALKVNCVEVILIRKGVNTKFDHSQIIMVSDEVMRKLSKNVSLVDVIAVCHKIKYQQNKEERVIFLDDVQDPGNVGTIIRSAHSFGFDCVYLSKASADMYNEKTIRSTQGALFHIRIETLDILDKIVALKAEGCIVYATALTNAVGLSSIDKTSDSVALVFGNEGVGVSKEVIQLCDQSVFVEMSTFESLNVGIAAGICMYEFRK